MISHRLANSIQTAPANPRPVRATSRMRNIAASIAFSAFFAMGGSALAQSVLPAYHPAPAPKRALQELFSIRRADSLVADLRSRLQVPDSCVTFDSASHSLCLNINQPVVRKAARKGVWGILNATIKALDENAYRSLQASRHGRDSNRTYLYALVLAAAKSNLGDKGDRLSRYHTWTCKGIAHYPLFRIPLGLVPATRAPKPVVTPKPVVRTPRPIVPDTLLYSEKITTLPIPVDSTLPLPTDTNWIKFLVAPAPSDSEEVKLADTLLKSLTMVKARKTEIRLDISGSVSRDATRISQMGISLNNLPSVQGRITGSTLPGTENDWDNYALYATLLGNEWRAGKGPENIVVVGDFTDGQTSITPAGADSLLQAAKIRKAKTNQEPTLTAISVNRTATDPNLVVVKDMISRQNGWRFVDMTGGEPSKLQALIVMLDGILGRQDTLGISTDSAASGKTQSNDSSAAPSSAPAKDTLAPAPAIVPDTSVAPSTAPTDTLVPAPTTAPANDSSAGPSTAPTDAPAPKTDTIPSAPAPDQDDEEFKIDNSSILAPHNAWAKPTRTSGQTYALPAFAWERGPSSGLGVSYVLRSNSGQS